MPKVTPVKSAQQRYETKPVIDPGTGEQKRTPVMNKRTGEQKRTKSGRLVFMDVTERDLDRPKPMPNCDAKVCKVALVRDGDKTIRVGDAYKHMSPKSGPYGGRTLSRHAECPTWQVWEYSQSLSARIAEAVHNAEEALSDVENEDGVQEVIDGLVEEIEGFAEEREDSASNMEDGFGGPTSASEQLTEDAEALREWVEDLHGLTIPSLDDFDCDTCGGSTDVECGACNGTGKVENDDGDEEDCTECSGSGELDCVDCDGDEGKDVSAWRDDVESDVTFESPL